MRLLNCSPSESEELDESSDTQPSEEFSTAGISDLEVSLGLHQTARFTRLALAGARRVGMTFWLQLRDRRGVDIVIRAPAIGGILRDRDTGGAIAILGRRVPSKLSFPPSWLWWREVGVRRNVMVMRGPRKATTFP